MSDKNMTMRVEREFTIKRKKHPSAPRYNGRSNQELGSSLTKLMLLLDASEVEQLGNRSLVLDKEGTALEFDAVLPTDILGIALEFEGEGYVSTMMEVISIENGTILGKDAYTEEEFSFTFEEASVARALGYFEILYRKDADGKDIPYGVDNDLKVQVMIPDTEPVADPNATIPAGLPANIGDIAAASTDPVVLKGLIEAAKASGVPVVPEPEAVSEVIAPVEDKCGGDCSTSTSCSPAKRSKRIKKAKPVEVDADGRMEQPELKRAVKNTKSVMAKSGKKWPAKAAKKAMGIAPPAGAMANNGRIVINSPAVKIAKICQDRDEAQTDMLAGAVGDAMMPAEFVNGMLLQSVVVAARHVIGTELEIQEYSSNTFLLAKDKTHFVRTYATAKKALGADFDKLYAEHLIGENDCARNNLKVSNGADYCYVLPAFNADGTHAPYGSKDIPWAQYPKVAAALRAAGN